MNKIEEVGKLNYETTTNICNKTRLQGICTCLRICVAGTSHWTAQTCVELALEKEKQGGILISQISHGYT